ncbi:MAG: cupredoxin domain-containing protein [Myxococcales bacterium]|nr:cupredoxin domain-containing protein [Myxococcales bacterium]
MRPLARACALALIAASALPLIACGGSTPAAAAADREVAIAVTAKGFEPKALTAKVGKPITLIVTRKVERTCATEIVIKDYGIDQPLPLDQPVKVTFTPTKPGKVRFACGMDMIAGEIAVQ